MKESDKKEFYASILRIMGPTFYTNGESMFSISKVLLYHLVADWLQECANYGKTMIFSIAIRAQSKDSKLRRRLSKATIVESDYDPDDFYSWFMMPEEAASKPLSGIRGVVMRICPTKNTVSLKYNEIDCFGKLRISIVEDFSLGFDWKGLKEIEEDASNFVRIMMH